MNFVINQKLNVTGLVVIFAMVFHKTTQSPLERGPVDQLTPLWRQFKKSLMLSLGTPFNSGRSARMVLAQGKFQKQIDHSVPFPCPLNNTRSQKRPVSVHALRPGDIDVIGAMGDSLTAGFGLTATNLLSLLIENRGMSFSGGGQGTWRNFLTLPNILKEFNPNLYGYALGAYLSTEAGSRLNVAEGSAISDNMPYMAKVLVERIKRDRNINLQQDWKMITLLIGDNDFCSELCYKRNFQSVLNKHKQDLLEVLRTLRDNLPRTFVNILPPVNVAVLKFTYTPSICVITHSVECPCVHGLAHRASQKKFANIIRKWQKLDEEIVNLDEFDTEDFTVVYQPFVIDASLPKNEEGETDLTELSEDCFHQSQKGAARTANNLWNNLLEPVGKKRTNETRLFERFLCPSAENPFLFTRRNSKLAIQLHNY
ncbi:phospholipase B1, membrane-associated-like [Agrilus planipennis]|uniref:Phospholipase B1, membrane-associated n=1 Tax=Agrilus planipennis TaxID=224129 RepID=A0A1W4WDL2_AGRPL|nr:phospholipase B1, membrane-associated-like [Agrilus planipennis]